MLEYEWLCQYRGTCRCNNSRAFGCTESSPRNAGESGGGQDGQCVHVAHSGRLPILYLPESQKFTISIKHREIVLFLCHQGLHQRGILLQEFENLCGTRSIFESSSSSSSFKSPLARPGWARFQEPKRPEPTFARRAQARKMKVSDRSDRSRMAGSTLPSELSSRQAEQGILEGPHEEDARHPILHDTIIYLEILV